MNKIRIQLDGNTHIELWLTGTNKGEHLVKELNLVIHETHDKGMNTIRERIEIARYPESTDSNK